jgi:putative cell wall-binding protein
MKVVSTNYTGVIPGIGKGPFTNKCISDQLFNTVRNLGYPVTITSVKAKPKVVVQNVSQKVEKKPITKVEESIKTAEKIATETAKPANAQLETPKEEPKVDAVETIETVTEAKGLTKEELEAKTVEELDSYLSSLKEVKRPIRYGKPWLVKQILAAQA